MNNDFEYQQEPFPPTPPKPQKKPGTGKVIALALCFSLLGSILGGAGVYFTLERLDGSFSFSRTEDTTKIQIGNRENVDIEKDAVDTGVAMTAAQVYEANVNSTVGITTAVTTNYWGYQTTAAASGSGFILTEDGYIVTNYHVIEDSSSITVSLYDGTTYDATVVGYDAGNDIAVIKVDATNLKPVVIGDSEKMGVGDTVLAIGNPLGELTFSLTHGVVSAIDRQITLSNGATMTLIQTDCTINSGNSGGALFNLYGEVVGITNAKYSNNGVSVEASIENIGFAIPTNRVMNMIESIIEKGFVAKPYIGVSVTDVSQETQSYGLPQGAAVREVVADSPAQKAGLEINDIITAVNGTPITGSSDLVSVVGKAAAEDVLKLSVYRKGQTLELEITVGEQIQSATDNSQGSQPLPSLPAPGQNY